MYSCTFRKRRCPSREAAYADCGRGRAVGGGEAKTREGETAGEERGSGPTRCRRTFDAAESSARARCMSAAMREFAQDASGLLSLNQVAYSILLLPKAHASEAGSAGAHAPKPASSLAASACLVSVLDAQPLIMRVSSTLAALLLATRGASAQSNIATRHELPAAATAAGALALDGSPAIYYIVPGAESTKFVLYQKGGGCELPRRQRQRRESNPRPYR